MMLRGTENMGREVEDRKKKVGPAEKKKREDENEGRVRGGARKELMEKGKRAEQGKAPLKKE